MSDFNSLGLDRSYLPGEPEPVPEKVVVQKVLHRILAFTRLTIDDVVNDPIAKNQVFGYYKLHKWVQRGSEIVELELQWNPRRMRV